MIVLHPELEKRVERARVESNWFSTPRDFYHYYFSGMYSTISPGWQSRALHILSIISMLTGSPLENLATVLGVRFARAYRSVFFKPLVAKSINSGLYEIPILSPYLIIDNFSLKVKKKSLKKNILLDNIFQKIYNLSYRIDIVKIAGGWI